MVPVPMKGGVASESFLAAGPRLVAEQPDAERSESFTSARSKGLSTGGSHTGAAPARALKHTGMTHAIITRACSLAWGRSASLVTK